jgi:ketosteroid isomerase-like protein
MATSEILDLVQHWAAAEQNNDAVSLGTLLTDDFVGVGPFGFVLTRAQWLERFGNGLQNQAVTVEDPQIHDYGSAAVVVGVQNQRTTAQGRDNSGRFRVTIATVRGADRWRVASVHIGPLHDPRSGPPDLSKLQPTP